MKSLSLTILHIGILCMLPMHASGLEPAADTFRPGWYAGINAGLNWHIAEGNFPTEKHLVFFSFKTNSGPVYRVQVGYNFTPVVGVRGMAGIVQHNWPKIHDNDRTKIYTLVSYQSQNLNIDLMVNLVNWWVGYNPHYIFDISAFVGTGLDHREKAGFSSDWLGMVYRGGIQGNFHVSRHIDLVIAAEVNLVSDNYNEIIASSAFEAFPALTIGFIIK